MEMIKYERMIRKSMIKCIIIRLIQMMLTTTKQMMLITIIIHLLVSILNVYTAFNCTIFQFDADHIFLNYTSKDDFYLYIDDTIEERLLFPMTVSDLAGMVCTALSIILSVGGGIGPGAILVAVNIIVMDFPPKVAIPLSIVTNLGVSTVGSIMNAKRKHPLSNRPIIDWDLVLIMEPVILLGAIIGTYMNKVIQGKVIIVLLVLLLSVIAHSTLKKARRMHHAEELYIKRVQWAKQKKMNQQSNPEAPVYPASYENKLEEADPPFLPKIHSISSSATQERNFLNDRENNMKREDDGSQSSFSRSFNRFIVLRKEDADSVKSSLIEEEAEYLPQNKISYIIAMFIFVIGMNTLKGGAAFESPFGIYCGSIGFWFFEFLNACWLIGCSFLAGRYLLRRHAIKEAVGYDYVRGDIRWDFKNIVIYPLSCIFFGILSGMFGVGVSVFLAPWLVGIGVNPAVASATCLCLNWFTALASTSSYVVLGSIIPDREYAYMLFVLGVVSSFLGRKLVNRGKSTTKIENNKRLERHSYMAYSMGVVVFISALSMTVEALVDVMNHSFEQDEFDGICEVERYFSY